MEFRYGCLIAGSIGSTQSMTISDKRDYNLHGLIFNMITFVSLHQKLKFLL